MIKTTKPRSGCATIVVVYRTVYYFVEEQKVSNSPKFKIEENLLDAVIGLPANLC